MKYRVALTDQEWGQEDGLIQEEVQRESGDWGNEEEGMTGVQLQGAGGEEGMTGVQLQGAGGEEGFVADWQRALLGVGERGEVRWSCREVVRE